MSGICGAWTFGGDGPELRPVLVKLERRGPDGTNDWADGPVALGHTSLATTPEALVEVLPLNEPESGCTITADARLDNRDELLAGLGLTGDTRTIGDGELILRAYVEWGEHCPERLLGDFAFAIWDPRQQRMFCARDHMGMRQLIYHHEPGELFAFATEAAALVAHSGVPKRIDEGSIAAFIDDLEGADFTSTFFDEVLRLPPAHSMSVRPTGLIIQRYWRLAPGTELKLNSDQDFAKAFLAVFTQAVSCRLRSAGPVGSMLSGGIDSNAVTAVAARLAQELGIFSGVASNSPDCVETQAIRATLAYSGYRATLVDLALVGDNTPELIAHTRGNAEPYDGQMTMIRSIYLGAHRQGIKVMLDGVGADMVLTPGNSIARSLRKGRLASAWRDAKARRRFWGSESHRPITILFQAAWLVLIPKVIRRLRRRIIEARYNKSVERGQQLVRPELARATGLRSRRRAYNRLLGEHGSIDAWDRIRTISHPSFVAGRERYDRVASALAIEPRDPFLDRRVVEFCVSLPPNQLEADGWPKIVLRRAMSGRVSDQVVWRRGKSHLGRAFNEAIINPLEGGKPGIGPVEAPYFSLRSIEMDSTSQRMDRLKRYKLVMLRLWIQRFGPSPANLQFGTADYDE